jgi:hypothetical protein
MIHWQLSNWPMLYVLLGSGLMSCLALFFTIKREMRVAAVRSRKRMDEILTRLNEAHDPAQEPIFIPMPARSGMNLSNRVQAMRMVRRNEDISHIAAVLGVPRREVELLIRVHQMSAGK